jgi:hypothetical protein
MRGTADHVRLEATESWEPARRRAEGVVMHRVRASRRIATALAVMTATATGVVIGGSADMPASARVARPADLPSQCSAWTDGRTSCTYSTPGQYSFTVPRGATNVLIDAFGAQGANGLNGHGTGGKGAIAVGPIGSTLDGQTLTLTVGAQGATTASGNPGPGGYPNGGAGGAVDANSIKLGGSGGGGASSVASASLLLLVAAGGGGAGATYLAHGGSGGNAGAVGTAGSAETSASGGGGGGAGLAAAGGSGGAAGALDTSNCVTGENGAVGSTGGAPSAGTGGQGGGTKPAAGGGPGGGGGGGYTGGGGGGQGANCDEVGFEATGAGGGGGGGGSFVDPSIPSGGVLDGDDAFETGNGKITLTIDDNDQPYVTGFTGYDTSTTGPYALTFSEPVTGVTTSSVEVVPDGTSTVLPATIVCTDPPNDDGLCQHYAVTLKKPVVPGVRMSVDFNTGPATIVDGAGNPVPAEVDGPLRFATNVGAADPALVYAWGSQQNVDAFDGSVLHAHFGGQTLQYRFSGTSLTWYTVAGPDQGKAKVKITNPGAVVNQTINNYAASTTLDKPVVFSGLNPGKHTLTITVLGTTGPHGTDALVSVDGFDSGAGVVGSPKVTATWTPLGYVFDNEAGASVTMKFTGTGVEWTALKGPNNGKAKVTIDGALKGTVDLYDPNFFFATLSYGGLTSGPHTLKITALGTKNPASSDTVVSVSGFTVL